MTALLLPLHKNISTWFLVGSAIYCFYLYTKSKSEFKIKNLVWLGIIPMTLIVIKLVGLINARDISKGIEEVVRYFPFLLLPLSMVVLAKRSERLDQIIFKALVLGCVIAITICWINAIQAVVRNNEPLSNLLAWKRSNIYLTRILDIHPPYLGFIIIIAISFLVKYYLLGKKAKELANSKRILIYAVIFFFILFLFHLVSRNSIILLILLSIGFTLFFKKKRFIFISTAVIMLFAAVIYVHPSKYLQRKYVKMLNLTDDELGDKRFSRLIASWNIFLEHPIIGAGSTTDDILRLEQYNKMDDQIAYAKNLNAHNQYAEYLASTGLIGLSIFITVIVVFLRYTIISQHYFYTVLLLSFLFSCLTESMLERELGIKIFSLILSLCVYHYIRDQKLINKPLFEK
ncbi:O-antigen ligase family protein [Gangjinia marincola]